MAKATTRAGFARILHLPWQAHLAIAVGAMLVSAFLPDAARSSFLLPAAKWLAQLAWFVALSFAGLAVVSYGIGRYKAERPFGLDLATGDGAKGRGKAGRPEHWSLELLQELEWKRFDALCAAYYAKRGFRVEAAGCTTNVETDAKLYFGESRGVVAIMRCTTWGGRVAAQQVRELAAVMAGGKVRRGVLHASAGCTEEAMQLARESSIRLVTGSAFLQSIGEMSDDVQSALLKIATEGDYTTPTCPACGTKMVMRSSEKGYSWRCASYPKCRHMLPLRAA
jgi:hypothetical protein